MKQLFCFIILIGLVIGSVVCVQADCTPAPDGITTWWPVDGTVIDIIDGHHGSENGTEYSTGKVGKALSFDGQDDYVSISDSADLSPHLGAEGEMTLEAWVKISTLPSSSGQGRTAIVAKGGSDQWEYALNVLSTGAFQFDVWNLDGEGYAGVSGGVVELDKWHHLAGVLKKGVSSQLYVDGELAAEMTSFSGDTGDGTSPLYIGRRGDGQYFNGAVDEVTLYGRALDSEEIVSLYTADAAGKCYAADPDPVIVFHPEDKVGIEAREVVFEATAMGDPRPTVQWLLNGDPLDGETNARLIITDIEQSHAGEYSMVATNEHGSVTSSIATLTYVEDFNLPDKTATNGAPRPDDLVSWWPGDSTKLDVVGQNHGTFKNGTEYREGKVSNAFSFDGSDDYMYAADDASLHSDEQITLATWFKVDSFSREWQCLISKGEGNDGSQTNNSDREYALWVHQDGKLHFLSTSSDNIGVGQTSFTTPAGSISLGQWHHAAGVIDCTQGTMTLYLDGEQVLSCEYSTSGIRTSSGPLYLGVAAGKGGTTNLDGAMDEIMLFNRALTDLEIAELYGSGAAGMLYFNDPAPVFILEPASQTGYELNSVSFEGFAMGTPRQEYQWAFNGTNLDGETNTTLSLDNLSSEYAGDYTLIAYNSSGSITSSAANLEVTLSPLITGIEGFEDGWNGWTADNGVWEVGEPNTGPGSGHLSANCAGTVLNGNYRSQTDSRLISPSVILPNVDGNEKIRLKFWQWFSYFLYGRHGTYDYGKVQISTDNGQTWTDLGNQIQDSGGGWSLNSIDLTAFAGQQVLLAFFHAADRDYSDIGWYVDDVKIEKFLPEFGDGTFEGGWGDWYADRGVWQVGEPVTGPGSGHLSANCAGTVLNGNYRSQTDSRLVSPAFSVPIVAGDEQVLLRYRQWYSYFLYGRHGTYDYGRVQISTDNGQTWGNVGNQIKNSSGSWLLNSINLTAYAGQRVRLAFFHIADRDYASLGWYIDDVKLTHIMPPSLELYTLQSGHLKDGSEIDYYVIRIPAGGHLTLTLDDLDDIGANEIYIKHGSLPSAGDYDYKFSDFGSADQFIYMAGAIPGYWFIMVTGSDVPEGGSEYTLLAEHATGVILDSVTPDHYGAAYGANLAFEGAGFTPGAVVELVRSGSVAATASAVKYYSGTKISAELDLTGLVPASDYTIRVRVGESEEELPFTVTEPLPAELKTNMILPGSVGYHRPATIWVEYENTGQVAMKAPLLVVGAKQGEQEGAILALPRIAADTGAIQASQARGFWTSAMPEGYANTVQFLASGDVPGLLQPGEKGRFPVYWAGWQQPWDFSYPPINFTLGVVEASNDTEIEWTELKDNMKPDSLDEETWDALWQAFTAEAGDTWGSYVDMLQDNAVYLGRQGLYINDISDLLAFEFAQADGMNVVRTLASSTDAHAAAPGLDITFSRSYGQSISSRHTLGDLGYGWSHNWEYSLEFETDGTVRMKGPGGSRRTYQPDSRAGYPYFSMEGDHAVFISSEDGFLHTESSGYARFFDSAGKLEYVEDTQGNRITCTYSGDQLIRLEHSSGQYVDIGWSSGQIASVTDPHGRTTSYTYGIIPGVGIYLFDILFYDGSSVSYRYENSGTAARQHSLLSITFPGSTHQYFNWNENGRLSGISRDNGAEPVSFSYGDAGEVYIKDVSGNTSSYFMNQNGVLVRALAPQGDEINLKYDLDYNLVSVIDPEGRSYTYDYDEDGNMTRMTDPLGYITRLSYTGPFDRLTALVDANGNVTRYDYTTGGGLASITYDDGSVESWTYDGTGSPDSWTNRRGSAVGYEYDSDGRLTTKVYTDGSRIEYFWDGRGNLDYTVDASGTTDFTYDENDFLVRIDYPGDHWLAYEWNEAGQRTSLTNELGNVQYYHYDAVGRLASMTDENDGLIVQYDYDTAGRLATKTLGNGVYTTYTYNEAWELVELSNRMPDQTILSQFAYEYDSRGRRVAMTSTYGQADDPRTDYMGRWEYEYDDLGQLVAWQDPTGHRVEYEYDGLGNRITVIEDGVVTDYTTNNLNQYTQVGDTTYTFDLDGNLIREDNADESWTTYAYNDENRLIATETSEGDLWEYEYNALGHRNRVTENGLTETHIIDPFRLGNLVGVHLTDADSKIYVHGYGLESQQNGTNPTEWFSFDAIGSVQEITLDSEKISQRNVYYPFGQKTLTEGPSESIFGSFGSLGVQSNTGNRLLYMRARFYDPEKAVFTSSDPIGIKGGDMNLQRYVWNNPMSYTDPLGLKITKSKVVYTEGEDGITYKEIEIIIIEDETDSSKDEKDFTKEKTFIKKINEFAGASKTILGKALKIVTNVVLDLIEVAEKTGREVQEGFEECKPEKVYTFYQEVVRKIAKHTMYLKDVAKIEEYTTGNANAYDPNLKTGPAGYGTANYVEAEQLLNYRIDFENESNATATAQTVIITDQLDTNLNWSTFTLTEVGFGDVVLSIPLDCHHYQHTVEMSQDGTDFEVQIDIGVNLSTGELYARFYSLDPITGLPPEADVGMLLPEDGTGRGMGWFNYTIEAKQGLAEGTEIRNVASIVFDSQPAIATNLVDPHDPSLGTDPDKEALVTIAPDEAVLTASSTEGGSVAQPGQGSSTHDWGDVITLTAVAETGYQFAVWQGDTDTIGDIYEASTTIRMVGDFGVTATFVWEGSSVIYVDAGAAGANNGRSWSNAFTNLQAALDEAVPGMEIWVSRGTYTPGTDRTDAFALKPRVGLYGGFTGQESERGQRDWVENLTILSGDIGVAGDGSDNSYHVLYQSDADIDEETVLDGFVITGGNADAEETHQYGGGMYNICASPTVRNCMFRGNTAKTGGGGMYNTSSSAPDVTHTIFQHNTAGSNGGAMLNHNYSSPRIANCTFYANEAAAGGAIYNSYSSPYIINTILWGDIASDHPEIYNLESFPVVVYCNIDQDGYESGEGNMRLDPRFQDAENGIFHLDETSDCLDMGDPVEWLTSDYLGGTDIDVDAVSLISPGDLIWITDGENTESDLVVETFETSLTVSTGFVNEYPVSNRSFIFSATSNFLAEPYFNGYRINMGAFGGTLWATPTNLCEGDIDQDKDVDGDDLWSMMWAFGASSGDSNYDDRADFDGNLKVDTKDLETFLEDFGRTKCPDNGE